MGSHDGFDRDDVASLRDVMADARDAARMESDACASQRDAAADERDHVNVLREDAMRNRMAAERLRAEAASVRQTCYDQALSAQGRFEQALIDLESARARCAALEDDLLQALDAGATGRNEAVAGRVAAREDRGTARHLRQHAADDWHAADLDRAASAAEREQREIDANVGTSP